MKGNGVKTIRDKDVLCFILWFRKTGFRLMKKKKNRIQVSEVLLETFCNNFLPVWHVLFGNVTFFTVAVEFEGRLKGMILDASSIFRLQIQPLLRGHSESQMESGSDKRQDCCAEKCHAQWLWLQAQSSDYLSSNIGPLPTSHLTLSKLLSFSVSQFFQL